MPENKGLVLIVEDEPHIADVQRRYLSREGFGVHVETDGAMALTAARRMRPVAIVLDIALPGMDGWRSAAGCARRATGLPWCS